MISDAIYAQAESLILSAIKSRFPSLDMRPNTPQYDTAVRYFLPIVADIVANLDAAERKRSAANYSLLTPLEVKAEAARYFTTPLTGRNSSGSVRLKFIKRQDINLSTTSKLSIGTFNYFPEANVAISAQSLSQDAVQGYYFSDITIQAEKSGSAYDVGAGATFSVDAYRTGGNLIEAIASTPITGGTSDENPQQVYNRIQKNQTTRNLVNQLSIEAVLTEKFQGVVSRLVVVGHTDPEMKRGLRTFIDPVFGAATLAMGGFTDVYVQTPIVRQAIAFPVLPGQISIDLSDYAPVLKVHGVSVQGHPEIHPYWAITGASPSLRYSAKDPIQLAIDPGLVAQTVLVDMSYAPDVRTIHDYCNSRELRLTCADLLVRFMIPIWLSGNIYVEGGFGLESFANQELQAYLDTLFPGDALVISKLTEAIHRAGVGQVFQDYAITGEVFLGTADNARIELSSNKSLRFDATTVTGADAAGFSARVSAFVNEGIKITAIT